LNLRLLFSIVILIKRFCYVILMLSDFASIVPFAVSTLEFMPQNADIVVDGPFAEPDEYFLARQKAAYGLDALVC